VTTVPVERATNVEVFMANADVNVGAKRITKMDDDGSDVVFCCVPRSSVVEL
jgi:hypothetical protein